MGRLAGSSLTATTDTEIYTVPANTITAFSVSVCTRSEAATIRLALTTGGTPAVTDWIEYDASLSAAGSVLERTGLMLSAGQKLYAYASVANVSVVVYGIEEAV